MVNSIESKEDLRKDTKSFVAMCRNAKIAEENVWRSVITLLDGLEVEIMSELIFNIVRKFIFKIYTRIMILKLLFLVGETIFWTCQSKVTHNRHEADVLHHFDKEMDFTNCIKTPRDYFCFKEKNVRRPKKWRITDEDYTDKEYSSLFTFHILPTTSMQTSMQNLWIECDKDADKEDCNENAAFQQCDKMFVKFVSWEVKKQF